MFPRDDDPESCFLVLFLEPSFDNFETNKLIIILSFYLFIYLLSELKI